MAAHGEPTAYDKLGGEAGIAAVVERFYQRVLADERLAPYFGDVDLDRLRAHQVAFLSAAVGGPRHYSGRSLAVAHAGRDIPREAFDGVLDHLVDALGEAGVTNDVIEIVVETLLSLESEVARS